MQKSMSLKCKPSSELLHVSAQLLFPGHAWTVLDARAAVSSTRVRVSDTCTARTLPHFAGGAAGSFRARREQLERFSEL